MDFVVYLTLILLLTLLLVHFAPFSTETVIAIAAGLLIWSLIEYAMHRLVLHGIQPFQAMHEAHHRHPQALIATPTALSINLIMFFVWLPTLLLSNFWLSYDITLGVTIGYFIYGIVHHVLHHWLHITHGCSGASDCMPSTTTPHNLTMVSPYHGRVMSFAAASKAASDAVKNLGIAVITTDFVTLTQRQRHLAYL
jgi:hypothetical protein